MSVNLTDQRVIFSDDGVLTDLSLILNTFRTDTKALSTVTTEDYLYIGSVLPFNHKYFEITSANVVVADITVQLWNGTVFVDAVDFIDETKNNTTTPLAVSGDIRFTPDRDESSWSKERDSADVSGLTGTNVNDLYWCRCSWSANVAFTIKSIGHKFSDDSLMFPEYPELNNSTWQAKFASGKTDWDEQHFIASQYIIRDLVSRNILLKQDQILEPETFQSASIHKTAEIIFGGMGESYADRRNYAATKYGEAMNLKRFNIDTNGDGINDSADKVFNSGEMYR